MIVGIFEGLILGHQVAQARWARPRHKKLVQGFPVYVRFLGQLFGHGWPKLGAHAVAWLPQIALAPKPLEVNRRWYWKPLACAVNGFGGQKKVLLSVLQLVTHKTGVRCSFPGSMVMGKWIALPKVVQSFLSNSMSSHGHYSAVHCCTEKQQLAAFDLVPVSASILTVCPLSSAVFPAAICGY